MARTLKFILMVLVCASCGSETEKQALLHFCQSRTFTKVRYCVEHRDSTSGYYYERQQWVNEIQKVNVYKKETPDRTLEFYNFWDYSNSANSDSWVSEKYLTWHVEADSILYHHESEYGPSETRVFNINGRSTPITILPLYAPKSEGIIGQEYFVDDIGIVLIKERDKVTYFDSTENHEKSEIARKAIEIILAEPSFNNFDWCEKAKKHPNWFYGHTHYCN